MGIVYILTSIVLIIAFLMLKKSDEKLNLTSFICLAIVVIFCYNILVCYILTPLKIPINLISLSIINLLISGIISIFILKKRQIQKYYIRGRDIICVCIILGAVLVIAYINYGFPLNIKYETGDPAYHYRIATKFAKSDKLLNDTTDELFTIKGFKLGSYVNSGIIMKCFSGIIPEFDYYKIFIIFGIFILFMSGYAMYTCLNQFSKNKWIDILACIVSLIYVMGYPLNSLLFGFEYLSMAILMITMIIFIVEKYNKNIICNWQVILLMALLNFGFFCSYYLFVIFTYPALFIYICIHNYKQDKKLFTKKNIITLIVALIIPFVLGVIYHFFPSIYTGTIEETSKSLLSGPSIDSFASEGYAYTNIYSNFILWLPMAIYVIIKERKEKNFMLLLTTFAISFILVLFLGNALGKVSIYYISKVYYVLWAILIYMSFKGLMLAYDEGNKKLPFLFIGVSIILIIISVTTTKINFKKSNKNPLDLMEIFAANRTMLQSKTDYNQKELALLKYAKNELDFSKKIEIIGREQQTFWSYPLLDYVNVPQDLKKYTNLIKITMKYIDIKEYICNNKIDYIIYINKESTYKDYKCNEISINTFTDFNVIYENEAGCILKRNT